MGLRDYELPTETVKIDDKTDFTVRGISVEDISRLVLKHGPVCVLVYTKFTEAKGLQGLRPETLGQLLTSVMSEFPEAIADLIATAADEHDQAAKVQKLPMGIQFDAIEKIIRLTFSGEADIKKLVETVTRMAEGVKRSADRLNAPIASGNGVGGFADR
jgi:hypothetical protein